MSELRIKALILENVYDSADQLIGLNVLAEYRMRCRPMVGERLTIDMGAIANVYVVESVHHTLRKTATDSQIDSTVDEHEIDVYVRFELCRTNTRWP